MNAPAAPPTSPSAAGADALRRLPRRHDTLVGVDSDGCMFDTMEVKQRRHFHPLIVRHWSLEPIERELRETAEFVNLHSCWRGRNRFTNLLLTFELLAAREAVRESGVRLPGLAALRAYCASGVALGNATLAEAVRAGGDGELARVLAWSEAVNADIDARLAPVAPFAWARRSLLRLARESDVLVVSQTPVAALAKEWRTHGLRPQVSFIAGQEHGSKAEHLRLAAGGRYAPGRVLMIGDAPGDQEAAERAGALFYPIPPGAEEEAWQRFHDEDYDRFLRGAYGGDHATALLETFRRALPATPPWVR